MLRQLPISEPDIPKTIPNLLLTIMPPDPSHNPSVRRASRKQPGEDEIDSRRARGEVIYRLTALITS